MPAMEASAGPRWSGVGEMPAVAMRAVRRSCTWFQFHPRSQNQNHRSQSGRELHLPQPVRRIECQPAEEAALLGRLQRFLQAHARRRHQIRRRLCRAILREQRVKLLLGLQFGCAVGAAGHVLLQFMAGIIGQLAINLEHDIFSNPFTLHKFTLRPAEPMWGQPPRLSGQGEARPVHSKLALTSYPPARRATSAWRGRACSWRSLPSYAKSLPRCAASVRDNASTQTPCARAESVSPALRRCARPTGGASNRVSGFAPARASGT